MLTFSKSIGCQSDSIIFGILCDEGDNRACLFPCSVIITGRGRHISINEDVAGH